MSTATHLRHSLHEIVDDLPDNDLPTARRILQALRDTADPVLRAFLSAPADDEPDRDDEDGRLGEARREAEIGDVVSHDEVKRHFGLE